MAFVAYHFNWSRDEVLNMAHWERQQWCEEISAINEKMNETSPDSGGGAGGQSGGGVLTQSPEAAFGDAYPDDAGF